jgi:hypothetical protein
MRNGQILGIIFDGLETVSMSENEYIEVAAIDVFQAAFADVFAAREIPVYGLAPRRSKPLENRSSFWLHVENGRRNIDLVHPVASFMFACARDPARAQALHFQAAAGFSAACQAIESRII